MVGSSRGATRALIRVRSWRALLTVVIGITGCGAVTASANAYWEAPTTQIVSSAGQLPAGGGDAGEADVTPDGRYVVFSSNSSNLVPGDTNNDRDVFRRDLRTNAVELVSAAIDGTISDQFSEDPSISDDGQYVVFTSYGTNLAGLDTNGREDIFRKDMVTGAIQMISRTNLMGQANNHSFDPTISGDAATVAFMSYATNLVAGDTNGRPDIFRQDLRTASMQRVSTSINGDQANGDSSHPSLDRTGKTIAFESTASNLAGGDDAVGSNDVFVRSYATGSLVRASTTAAGAHPTSDSIDPAISGDGNVVVFTSFADDIAPGDSNLSGDIYRRDLAKNQIELVSKSEQGQGGSEGSFGSSVSTDGRFVAFYTRSKNLGVSDENGQTDVYVKDTASGSVRLASATPQGATSNAMSYDPQISDFGRIVAFESPASNLVADDTDGQDDVFVRDAGIGDAMPQISTSTLRAQSGDTVTLDSAGSLGSEDPPGSGLRSAVTSVRWMVPGQGVVGSGSRTNLRLGAPGITTVQLEVTDAAGARAVASKQIEVLPGAKVKVQQLKLSVRALKRLSAAVKSGRLPLAVSASRAARVQVGLRLTVGRKGKTTAYGKAVKLKFAGGKQTSRKLSLALSKKVRRGLKSAKTRKRAVLVAVGTPTGGGAKSTVSSRIK